MNQGVVGCFGDFHTTFDSLDNADVRYVVKHWDKLISMYRPKISKKTVELLREHFLCKYKKYITPHTPEEWRLWFDIFYWNTHRNMSHFIDETIRPKHGQRPLCTIDDLISPLKRLRM